MKLKNISNDLTVLYSHGTKYDTNYLLDNLESLNGLFSYVIRDNINKKIYLFQDRMCDIMWLYYTVIDGKLYFDNDFNKLVKLHNNVSMNINGVYDYMMLEYVALNRTLLNEINKVPAHKMMIFDEISCNIEYKSIYFKNIQCRDDNIIVNLPELNVEALGFSNGNDSNILLQKYFNKNIKLITIAGNLGRNTKDRPIEIAKYYELQNNHIIKIFNSELLQKFPEIVYRCNNCYNKGAFTQYLMAEICIENNIKTLCLGEGNNQITLSNYQNFLNENATMLNTSYRFTQYDRDHKTLLNTTLYRNIKRTGTIFNSFNIIPIFPFLDLEYIKYAKNEKRYLNYVKESLPEEVYNNIERAGGSVRLINLFNNIDEYNKLKEFVMSTEIYNIFLEHGFKYKRENDEYSDHNEINGIFVCLYLYLFELIYVKKTDITTLNNILDINI